MERSPEMDLAPAPFGRWQPALRIASWVLLAAVIVVTLVPEQYRPSTPLPLKVERALGFAVLTFVFTLGYPRRWLSILIILSLGAIGLELLQFLIPSRDPSPVDAAVKIIGACCGVGGAAFFLRLSAPWHRR
jgi:VanZ family protein